MNLAYYHYGAHRCSLAQDSDLGEALYRYVDIATALRSIDCSNPEDRTKCLGLISGYLCKKENDKGRMSLDSRSCKLLAIFAPFDTPVTVPFKLGAEDALAFRINQFNLGAPLKWYRLVNNMREVTMDKISNINTEIWNNTLPEDLVKDCYELALYDSESRNEEDQQDQKDLWIRMFERTKSYEEGVNAMTSWLQTEAFQHYGNKTHRVLQFLQESCQKVTKKTGKWNLWYPPLRVLDGRRILSRVTFQKLRKNLRWKKNLRIWKLMKNSSMIVRRDMG